MPRLLSQNFVKWLTGIALLIAVLVLVQWQYGWRETLNAWGNVSPVIVLLAFVLFAISHIVRAYRIYCFLFDSSYRFLPLIKVSAIHQWMNNLLPMRLGEATFPILLKRHYGVGFAEGVSRLIWLRLLDLLIMGGLCAFLVLMTLPMALRVWVVAIGFLLLLLGGVLAFGLKGLPSWLHKVKSLLISTAPKSLKHFLQLLSLTVLAWLCKLAAVALVIIALAPLSFFSALAGALGAELSGILPIHGVLGAGSYEAAFFAGLALFNEPSPELLALAVNTHLFVFLSTSLVTLLTLAIRLPKATV